VNLRLEIARCLPIEFKMNVRLKAALEMVVCPQGRLAEASSKPPQAAVVKTKNL
jgi:hypothetical protein